MGMLARRMTRRWTEPHPAPLGPWLPAWQRSTGPLTRQELLTLATLRALVGLDLSRAQSSWSRPDGERVSDLTLAMRETPSMVRVESMAAPGDLMLCGAAGPAWLSSDWVLRTRPGDVIEVPEHRILDDAIPNRALLQTARDALASALAHGPGRVTVTDGPPDAGDLVVLRDAPFGDRASSIGYDYLLPLPEGFHDGATVPLPPEELTDTLAAFDRERWPSARNAGPSVRSASLAGGRPGHTGAVRITTGPALVLDLPEEGDLSQQRTFRAAMTLLLRLADGAPPQTADALRGFLRRCCAMHRRHARSDFYRPLWNGQTPAGTVTLSPGVGLPVGVVVEVSEEVSLGEETNRAQAWLIATERLFTRGLRKETRDENRVYLRRGPAVLMSDGTPTPHLRYAHSGAVEFPRFALIGDDECWFWETTVRSRVDAGRRTGVLMVTGLSRVGDIVCYGQELVRLLDTFAWLVAARDPTARIRTVTMWV